MVSLWERDQINNWTKQIHAYIHAYIHIYIERKFAGADGTRAGKRGIRTRTDGYVNAYMDI